MRLKVSIASRILEKLKKQPSTLEELKSLFDKYNIDISNWSKGDAKDVDDLLTEIKQKESVLVEERNKLLRETKVLMIDVRYSDGNTEYLLKEDRQEFKDGRTRIRKLDTSLAEKLTSNEKFNEKSVYRALKEELKISSKGISSVKPDKEFIELKDSMSYPNLKTKFIFKKFVVNLTSESYDPNGYIENQKKKSTYFKWVKQ